MLSQFRQVRFIQAWTPAYNFTINCTTKYLAVEGPPLHIDTVLPVFLLPFRANRFTNLPSIVLNMKHLHFLKGIIKLGFSFTLRIQQKEGSYGCLFRINGPKLINLLIGGVETLTISQTLILSSLPTVYNSDPRGSHTSPLTGPRWAWIVWWYSWNHWFSACPIGSNSFDFFLYPRFSLPVVPTRCQYIQIYGMPFHY